MIRLSTEYFHFMEISNLYIHKHWEFHGFSSTLTLRGCEGYGKSLCFLLIFPYYVNSLFPYFRNCMDCALSKIFEKAITLECLCFPRFFHVHFGNCMDFCFTQNSWESNYFGMFAFSQYFSRIMRNHFSHVLGIVWISASSEIFEKPTDLKGSCFPILFSYCEKSTFPMCWELHGFLLQAKNSRNP